MTAVDTASSVTAQESPVDQSSIHLDAPESSTHLDESVNQSTMCPPGLNAEEARGLAAFGADLDLTTTL